MQSISFSAVSAKKLLPVIIFSSIFVFAPLCFSEASDSENSYKRLDEIIQRADSHSEASQDITDFMDILREIIVSRRKDLNSKVLSMTTKSVPCSVIEFGTHGRHLAFIADGSNIDSQAQVGGLLRLTVTEPDGSVCSFDDPRNTVVRDRTTNYHFFKYVKTPSGSFISRSVSYLHYNTDDFYSNMNPLPGEYIFDITYSTSPLCTGTGSMESAYFHGMLMTNTIPNPLPPCLSYDGHYLHGPEDHIRNIPLGYTTRYTLIVGTTSSNFSIVSGKDQVGVAGQPLTDPLVVITTDTAGAPVGDIDIEFSISSAPANAANYALNPSSATTDKTTGLAQTQFTLGDIPSLYEVTATCNDCDPSTVTFKACGKLKNANYKQGDSQWRNEHYDNRCKASSSTVKPGNYDCGDSIFNQPGVQKSSNTISGWGCALSCLANLVSYAHTLDPSITVHTPLSLNGVAGVIVHGAVQWPFIKNVTNNKITYQDRKNVGGTVTRDSLITEVDNILEATPTVPVVLKVVRTTTKYNNQGQIISQSSGPHFLMAVGKCADEYIVSDPGYTPIKYDPKNGGIVYSNSARTTIKSLSGLKGIRIFKR